MSDNHAIERRKHEQRVKLGVLVICTPWLLLGLVGLVSAGVTAAKAARLPIEEIRPLAIATLAGCALVSIVGLAITILGVAGLLATSKKAGQER